MGKIYSREQISKVIEKMAANDIINSIEEGFVAYSRGKVVVPPVGELIFKDPPGECHIKYGYIIIRPGTHITAMGSDTPEKQELDPEILGKADRVVADSIDQS